MRAASVIGSDHIERPVVYVCRDIERALGLELPREGYFIITNKTTFSEKLQEGLPPAFRKQILLIKSETKFTLDTHELLTHPQVVAYIKDIQSPAPAILVFKNTLRIEEICREQGWLLLNPSAQVAAKVEEKISQVEWLGELTHLLPPHEIIECSQIDWKKSFSKAFSQSCILQFNHAHSGEGTLLVENTVSGMEKLAALQAKFPKRLVRKTAFISGQVFTCNAVVLAENIAVGNISYQITGLSPFTDNSFATVGNDWSLAHQSLSAAEQESIRKMATAIGERLRSSGWKGLFGIDVIIENNKNKNSEDNSEDKENNNAANSRKIFLLEINARQPASATFESSLQRRASSNNPESDNSQNNFTEKKLTIFEAHLKGLTEESAKGSAEKLPEEKNKPTGINAKQLQSSAISLIPICAGAQLIQRVTEIFPGNRKPREIGEIIERLEQKDLHCIPYDNIKPNSDFLRIQTYERFLKNHAELNELGTTVAHALTARTLSSRALTMIADFLHLPPPLHGIACPYYNNRRAGMRAGLRPLIGKGNPREICDESVLIALRKKIALAKITPDEARKFLVENHLGIDCSAFVYHVLDAETHARRLGSLRKHISRPYIKNPVRKFLTLPRIVESTDARTFTHEKNSHEVQLEDARPGDFIVLLETGPQKTYNHIMLIHEVEDTFSKKLYYTHSFAWPTDGLYNHGVRQGMIEIIDSAKPLIEQLWIENGKAGSNTAYSSTSYSNTTHLNIDHSNINQPDRENFTFEKAREAKFVGLRRLNWF
jgi:hypothetical protein